MVRMRDRLNDAIIERIILDSCGKQCDLLLTIVHRSFFVGSGMMIIFHIICSVNGLWDHWIGLVRALKPGLAV
jgi:hypothetical protein